MGRLTISRSQERPPTAMALPKSPSSSESSTWSALPKELLESILSRLDLADHVRFTSVCKWWRSIAAADNPATTNKPFILVRSVRSHYGLIRRLLCSFWPSWIWAWTLGFFEGWLVFYTDHYGPNLLNPSSPGSPIIPLPSLPYPLFKPLTNNQKVILSSPPSSAGNRLVILKDKCNRLAFCRLGEDTDWTYYYKRRHISDIIFCKDQLCAISSAGHVKIFDSTRLDSRPPIKLNFPAQFQHGNSRGFYLAPNASHDDKLFAVRRVLMGYDNRRYEVFEIDPRRGSYVNVESLGDYLLFLSPFCTLTLHANDLPDFQPNHIYICSENAVGSFSSYSLDDKITVRVDTMKTCPIFFTLFGTIGFQHI